MAMLVTWTNIFKMAFLAMAMLATVLGGAMAVMDRRLDERMSFYQSTQLQLHDEINRLNDRITRLEQK